VLALSALALVLYGGRSDNPHFRGDELLVMTAQLGDTYKLNAIVKSAQMIISDQASFPIVEAAVKAAREDIIRPPA